MALTPRTRARRAARSPRRVTTSRTTTERKRSRATRASTRRARGPVSASPARPGPSPRPRARQSARSRSQAGSSAPKETLRRRSALSVDMPLTRARPGAHRPLPARSSTRLARRRQSSVSPEGLRTYQKPLCARAARKATMRRTRAQLSVLLPRRATSPIPIGPGGVCT